MTPRWATGDSRWDSVPNQVVPKPEPCIDEDCLIERNPKPYKSVVPETNAPWHPGQ